MSFGYGDNKLRPFVLMLPGSITVPMLGIYPFGYQGPKCLAIYVPDESVEAYKTAKEWKNYADIIYPLSMYQG